MTGEIKIPPEGEEVYSNAEHEFQLTEDEVKNSGKSHGHAAWEFHGMVWYDKEKMVFRERIKRYRVVVDYLEDESLEDLIREACDKWGWG